MNSKHTFPFRLLRPLAMLAAGLLLTMGLLGPAAAQQSTLTAGTPVEGTIARAGDVQRWALSGVAGEVLSFTVEPVTGSLDPVIRLIDGSGRVLIANDDYAPPTTRDALLEAITLPRIDTYTLEVSGYGETTGRYLLSAQHGFAGPASPAPGNWAASPAGSPAEAVVVGENGAVDAAVRGVRARALIVPEPAAQAADAFHLSVDIDGVTGREGWRVGLMLHQGPAGYYAVEVNDAGEWRFIRHDGAGEGGEDVPLRDWATAPPIRPGETAFRLSALGRNGVFSLFYNGSLLATLGDTALPRRGALGVLVGTRSSLESAASVSFSQWSLNAPLLVEGGPVRPTALTVSDGARMTQELVRRADVSGLGALALNVPESTVQESRGGVQRQMLGQETAYSTFALATTITLSGAAESGCGIVFGYRSETDYLLAYIDRAGAYGISRRTADGFAPGLAGEQAEFDPAAAHHLLIVQNPSTLAFYLDGGYVGSLAAPVQAGEIGIAVVNPTDTATICMARDLWLWRWP